jgi:hypothetical protein
VRFLLNGVAVGNAITTPPYSATWTPTVAREYTLVAEAMDNLGNLTSSPGRLITVVANSSPVVVVTNPSAPLATTTGVTVNLVATASDLDGTVARVRFLANGTLVGSALTAAPYSTTWTPTTAGVYSIVAEATDDVDNVTAAAPVVVTVAANRPPMIEFTTPNNGTVIRLGAATTLAVNATDADGTIARVQFFVDGAALGASIAQFPYRTTWTSGAEGTYRITAAATDNAGATTNSSTVTMLVTTAANAGDNVANGIIVGPNESGTFSAINVRGKTVTFIGTSTVDGTPKTYFFPGVPAGTDGSFRVTDAQGRPTIAGSFSDISASGALDNNRVSFSGQAILFPGAVTTVASGYYAGNLTGRPASTVAAIIALDGSLTLYVADGGFQTVGTGAVDATGVFDFKVGADVRLTGKADPATGFLTGILVGGPGGAFTAATSSGASFSDGSLRNLSTRGQIGTGGNVLIAGFVVGGTSPKQLLIRAVGPTLGLPPPQGFGFPGSVVDPVLSLYANNVAIAGNDNWSAPAGTGAATGAVLATTFGKVGAFPLTAGTGDAAILVTLAPGNYSAQISSGGSGATGIGLVEIYDVDSVAAFSAQKVMNLSTRGLVGANQAQLIAGFVVGGSTAKKVMIRAAGPGLAAVAPSLGGTVLADPLLRLVRVMPGGGEVYVRENDSWETGNDVALVRDASAKLGAFPFAAGSRDAVILLNLPPGTYSAQVTGAGTTTGVALVEIWEVP